MVLTSQGGLSALRRIHPVRIVLALLLALAGAVATTGSGGGDALAGARYTSEKSKVARGLYLIRKYDNKLDARIKVLRVDPSTSMTLDVSLSNDKLPQREKTTAMAARHNAIAAINASVGNSWGRPIGVFAEDGSLKTSPMVTGGAFSYAHNESEGHIGYPGFKVRAYPLEGNGPALWVNDWNDPIPHPDKISGYTPAGGDVVKTPENSCSARLKKLGKVRWARGNTGVSRTYRVTTVRCRQRRMPLKGGIVLAAPRGSTGATKLQDGPNRDDKLNLTWSVGWTGALDVVGGSPVLLLDKKIIAEPCGGYVCKKHPRSGVGVTESGIVLLVTVDGRQADSKGMTILQFARLFKKLGAQKALNLDGGGSSTMVVKGEVVNSPSGGGERSVASALLVLNHADGAEPDPVQPLAP